MSLFTGGSSKGQPNVSIGQRRHTLNLIWIMTMTMIPMCWFINLKYPKGTIWPVPLVISVAIASLGVYALVWLGYRMTLTEVNKRIGSTAPSRLTSDGIISLQASLQNTTIAWLVFLEAPTAVGLWVSTHSLASLHLFEWLAISSFIGLVIFRLRGYPQVLALLDKLELQRKGLA